VGGEGGRRGGGSRPTATGVDSPRARPEALAMDTETFLAELDQAVAARLDTLGRAGSGADTASAPSIADLLVVALKKELEAAEEAALWMTTESDLEVKLALARQCGDEARHFRLIEARLRELGRERPVIPTTAEAYSPMFRFLAGLATSVERVAAGQFAREGLAQVHNAAFIELCEKRGDGETAKLYRDVIQPDEAHHHQAGRRLVARLAVTDSDQARARAAADRTLELAEELTEIARLRGMIGAPGC
jgi:hypothetical protein